MNRKLDHAEYHQLESESSKRAVSRAKIVLLCVGIAGVAVGIGAMVYG